MRTNPDRNFSSIFKGLSKILRLTESDCNKTNKHVKIPYNFMILQLLIAKEMVWIKQSSRYKYERKRRKRRRNVEK